MSHEILIVEDDSALREALAQVLSDEGYELFSARDGLEAVNCLKKGNRPDVILLDLSMPVVNGWEFRMFQKRDPELAAIPVILITAGGYTREEVAWLEPAALIPKPVDLTVLLSVVQRFSPPGSVQEDDTGRVRTARLSRPLQRDPEVDAVAASAEWERIRSRLEEPKGCQVGRLPERDAVAVIRDQHSLPVECGRDRIAQSVAGQGL
jgi:CheY-like chemotaxis protein